MRTALSFASPIGPSPLSLSSDAKAISDDSNKDFDNLSWIFSLKESLRAEWVGRLNWVRWVDRLAEAEALNSSADLFSQFRDSWSFLKRNGHLPSQSPFAEQLSEFNSQWLQNSQAN